MHDIIYVKAANCEKSPLNVRKTSDPEKDAQLKANIAANGILQNLIALPVARKKNHYRIIAGGRRLDGVHGNIADGVFPADYEIPVKVLQNAKDALETSLSENFFQLDMNPADACRAFQDIIETEGKQPADIAKRYGLTERFVRGRLRLASLAEPVFEALREGDITLDIAMAYASTSDTDRQADVFGTLRNTYYADNVNEIRRYLASGSYKGGDAKALLVGAEAYQAAGGRIDKDLFSDTASEIWLDGDILEQLADEALTAAAERIREQQGYAEVRPVRGTHLGWSQTEGLEPLVGEPQPLTQEYEQRKAALKAELEEIEASIEQAEDEEVGEELEARLQTLNAELGRLQVRPPAIGDDQKARAVAFLTLGADGQPYVHDRLFALPEVADEEPGDPQPDHIGGADADPGRSDDDAPGRPTYSARLLDELAIMKTELLKVHIANNARFALDLGTFLMADAAEARGYQVHPSELRAPAPTLRVYGFESGAPAAEGWTKVEEALDRTWLGHEAMHERYDAFCALDEEARAAWLGWAIARTLHAVPFGQSGSAFLNRLGEKLAIDVAAWWRPTARNFFDRISKAMILGLFEDVGGAELRSRYATSRKFDLAASSEKLFAGETIVDPEVKERAIAWLPEPMRFVRPEPSTAKDSQEETAAIDNVATSSGVTVEAPDPANDPDDLADAA